MSDNFIKTPKQKLAVQLMASDAKHICLYGGSRAGKTLIILYAMIIRGCKVKCRQAILRLTFNSAKRSIWLDSLPGVLNAAFPDLKVKWNKTDYYIELPNGSQIFVGGLEDKERTEKILGTEYVSIFFDEVSQIPYEAIQVALSRLAQKTELKNKAYYAMNPPSKSDWQYWLFEKKLNPIDNEPLNDSDSYVSMLLTPHDNLSHIDSDYIKLLESMPKVERERFLYGLYSETDSGVVHYGFSRERHVANTKIEPGTLFSFHDWNVHPMTAVIAQFIGGVFYIHDELFLSNSDTYKMCNELRSRGYTGTTAICDSTGENRKTSGKSDFDILKENGITILTSRNPFIKDRCNNANRLFEHNKIVINPKCKKLINDLEKVSWKDNNIYPGPDKMLGHLSDALGYGLWKLDPIGLKSEKYTMMAR